MTEITEERRRYFRLDDTMNLHVRCLDAAAHEWPSYVTSDVLSNCTLSSALELVSQEAHTLMARLEKGAPELADYFKIVETQLGLVAQAIANLHPTVNQIDTRPVTISAAGLAFRHESALSPGQWLEMRMFLSSSMVVMGVMGRVIHARPVDDDNRAQPFSIGVEYHLLRDDDRELLIKHVLKRQLQQLQHARNQRL
jgi:c-di-GMP-binding flagellar brake protein YcgR